MILPFENDARKIVKRLAKRSMEADKLRNLFVVITIVLAVCLMGTLCFTYSAQRMQTLERIQGQYQAGCNNMSQEAIEELVGTGKLEKWGYATSPVTIRYMDSNLNVSFVSPTMIDLMHYGKLTGSYPQKENEICVEQAFLEHYKLPVELGQSVSMDLGNGESIYTITGILETENSSKIFMIWISDTVTASKGEAPYELRFRFIGSHVSNTEQLRADIEQFFEEMGIPKDDTFFSSNYFDLANVYIGNDIEIFILAILILAICAIVIYNIFYISVMGKMHEYGRLKVLGATPQQLKSVVKRERLFLSITAIPLGLIAAAIITLIAMHGYWAWRENVKYAFIISMITYLVVLIATRKPLALVGKVSAIAAIGTTAYSQQQGRGVSKQLHRRLSMPRLALMNFSRSRKKAAVTSLSLGLTGILLISISAYANSVDAREMALASFGDQSDYLLQYESYFGQDFVDVQMDNPLDAAFREEIADLTGVDYITAYSATAVQIPQIKENEAFTVRGLTRKQMSEVFSEKDILAGTVNYQQLLEQDGILVALGGNTLETVYGAHFKAGDTITFTCYNGQEKSYTVMGIVKEIPLVSSAHFFILPEEELHELYPEIEDFTAFINIHAKQDTQQLRQTIFDAVSDSRLVISVLDDLVVNLENGLQKEMTKYYCLLIFIFAFSLLNLANTLITNLLSRQQEFGVFQSVGMSNRQLSKMLSFECCYYIGITILITLSLGTGCSLLICNIFNQVGLFGKITYHFPAVQVLVFVAALIVVQIVFSVLAIAYSKRFSLVERIRAAD